MENPEEILHSLEEFSKTRPKDIPRELEDYLRFVAKTGDPIYQWSAIKSLFREKMLNVITNFYETCPSVEIPPCPNVDIFNYDVMKNFILERLDAFVAAPFTLQRISELLTAPRKEYNRIDKYMRALEKNVLVVSTTEPGGGRRATENGDGVMNGLEGGEHIPETSSGEINVEEMDEGPVWPREEPASGEDFGEKEVCTSSQEEQVNGGEEEKFVPAGLQKRRSSIEPVVSSEEVSESCDNSEEEPRKEEEEDNSKEEAVTTPTISTTSDQHLEDADSSSSTEEDKDTDLKDIEKTIAVNDEEEDEEDSAINEEILSSSEDGIKNVIVEEEEEKIEENEVGTSDHVQISEEVINEQLKEEETIDTTKCSQNDNEEEEISSSEKVKVDWSEEYLQIKTSEDEKIENETMEVDEDVSSSEKVKEEEKSEESV